MEYAAVSSIPNVAKSGDAVLYGCSGLISPDIGRRAVAYQGVYLFGLQFGRYIGVPARSCCGNKGLCNFNTCGNKGCLFCSHPSRFAEVSPVSSAVHYTGLRE